jgi:hypothetical protein
VVVDWLMTQWRMEDLEKDKKGIMMASKGTSKWRAVAIVINVIFCILLIGFFGYFTFRFISSLF